MRKLGLIIIVTVVSAVTIAGTGIGIWLGVRNQEELPHPNSEWSFKISGNIIGDDFNITIAELLAMPSHKDDYVMRGDTTYTAEFEGVLLSYLFENIVDIDPLATSVTFIAQDGYSLPSINIADLLSEDSPMIAYKMDGHYLESYEDDGPGYLRLIIPEDFIYYNGQYCLKNLAEINFS